MSSPSPDTSSAVERTAEGARISIVLVAGSGWKNATRTLDHLRSQTVASAMEVLVVCAKSEIRANDHRDHPFQSLVIVPVERISARGTAAAAGMRAASAPLIGLIEDHSFPAPNWAEELIAALGGHWDGVGPIVHNANPESALSWVNFALSYGAMSTGDSGERELIPWHNSAYKRSALLPVWDRLEELLSWEGWLQRELRSTGRQLFLTASTSTSHLNVSSFTSSLLLNYQRGRGLAATRAADSDWSVLNRTVRAAAFPVYPLMQFRMHAPLLGKFALPLSLHLRAQALLAVNLVALAVGEAVGMLLGLGDAIDRMEDFELKRLDHVTARDGDIMATRAADRPLVEVQRTAA